MKDVSKAGVTFTLPDGGKGFCAKAALEHSKAAPVAGKSVKCVVLDVNAATGLATVCLDAGVVAVREGLKDAKARVAAAKGTPLHPTSYVLHPALYQGTSLIRNTHPTRITIGPPRTLTSKHCIAGVRALDTVTGIIW